MFYFAGAGDFNATRAYHEFSPINLDQSEGFDLGMGNFNGEAIVRSALKGGTEDLYESTELHYHSGSGFHGRENYNSAMACAKEIKRNLDLVRVYSDEERVESKWIALGYSNGGAQSIDFQNDVENYNIEMDLVITVDPIVQTLIFPVHGFKDMIGKRNPKTKRFLNLYQNTDIDTLPLVSLRGKPVEDADINMLLDSASGLNRYGSYNHMYITTLPKVKSIISQEIDNLLK